MLSTIFATLTHGLNKACSPAWCSRIALTGVIFLSLWSFGHASDYEVRKTKVDAQVDAVRVTLASLDKGQAELQAEIEKNRREAAKANAETSRRLDELQKLLIQVLAESRKR